MKTYTQIALILLLCCLGVSCKKVEKNPCEGLLNEAPPKQIGLVFINKETGENMIVANSLDTAAIKITGTLSPFKMIINDNRSPLNGMLVFTIPETGDGNYVLSIAIADFETVELAYSISKMESNDVCKPYYYSMSDIQITNHPFAYFENEHISGRKNLLKVLL